MEEQKLVLQDGTYKYDDHTRQVSVSEDELLKLGWWKLGNDEQVVSKVKLSEDEARFMEENKYLVFSHPEEPDFETKVAGYVLEHTESLEEEIEMYERLTEAYFCGYTVRETKYYIKFPLWIDESKKQDNRRYLNINEYGDWELNTKSQIRSRRTQFTQGEIDKMQEDERAKGFNLDTLKVKVPDDELED
ncbi:MAG: DUF1642 domain-containing protein [Ligilactobacillus animalis]|uniref:DUF1642 domain-containing protein n=1 Tax=Ligilactobacillus animalis TaxID=1605 RepID=UPI00242EA8E8|nr:DUF1642 domain-containing protein [Ligilactobacillus animalis]MCI5941206.1 DUF1642 domain-containing protein [Ligilactobacillus animalis]MDY2993637.1 DUF1642 domain-containing protein [Ligilactobacillus animalis]